MHRDTVLRQLEKAVANDFNSKTEAAAKFGITTEHLRRVLKAGHPFTESMLDYLGLEKHILVTYHKKSGK